jgi:hypothetical protein
MEREQLVANLEIAKWQVHDGDIQIVKQKQLIAKLSAIGSDTTSAEQGLKILRLMQDSHRIQLEWFLEALGKLPE